MSKIPVADISKASGMSRQYVYCQKFKVEAYITSLDEKTTEEHKIVIDKDFIVRAILSLALDGHASLEGIQRFFENVLRIQVSTGYISTILKQASERAQIFDDNISLERIHQGANDEIFQGNTPILTGIDVESTYVYLLEEAKDRTAETWQIYLEDRKEHGLNLDVTINDGATGLIAGISKAYPGIEIQQDTFHALRSIGREVTKVERQAYSKIAREYDLEKRVHGLRAQAKTKEKLEEIRPKTKETIGIYDNLYILFCWLRELLGFSGYGLEDTIILARYILDEMEKNALLCPGLLKQTERFRTILPSVLSFINRLEREIDKCAKEKGIPPDALRMMYRQMSFGINSESYQEIEYRLVMLLMQDYDQVREAFKQLLSRTKKASSLVENLNGRIRGYINIKRVVPTRFFVLMKVYFNTRRYKRSHCKERIGKSPLELLTGKEHPEFLDALGY